MGTTIKAKQKGMHNPAHTGEILRDLFLAPLEVTQAEAADALGVTRKHLSGILNQRASVTADMAIRLAIGLETDPDFWLNLQSQYDLWVESKKARPQIRPLRTAGANRLVDIQTGR
jgi:addiction module HigA family antidote